MVTLFKILAYLIIGYTLYLIFVDSDVSFFIVNREFTAPENRGALWGKRSCNSLIEGGKLLPSDQWKPDGCQLIMYNKKKARQCFKRITEEYGSAYISFVGDSRMRTLLRNIIGLVNESSPLAKHDKTHSDIRYLDPEIGLHAELAWEPYIDDNMMKRWNDWQKKAIAYRPLVAFVGSGNWFVRKYGFSTEQISSMKHKLERLRNNMEPLVDNTAISWRLQDPVKYKLLNSFRKNLTNENLNKFNDLAIKIFAGSVIPVVKSFREVALRYNISDYGDGLHACCKTARKDTQLLMNYICNPFLSFDSSVCCSFNSY
ncbi:Uncharacterised protein at_DN1737 [Pycnogonum litorale]